MALARARPGLEGVDDEPLEEVDVAFWVKRLPEPPELGQVRAVWSWLHLVDDRSAGVGGAVAGVDERRRGEHGRLDPLRNGRRELDRDHGAGVVADDRGPLDPERVQEARRDLGPALDRVVPERRP